MRHRIERYRPAHLSTGPSIPELGPECTSDGPSETGNQAVTVGAVFLGVSAYLFAVRARNWERGAPERRTGHWGRRFFEFWRGVSMRSVLEDPAAGIMHALIYFGFVLLLLGTATVELDHLAPMSLKFLEGVTLPGVEVLLDKK